MITQNEKPSRQMLEEGSGYTKKDHNEGWTRLCRVSGHRFDEAGGGEAADVAARNAIAELDRWD